MYVKLSQLKCITAFEYTMTNCHRLKYLYYGTYINEAHDILPSSSNCHLRQLCVISYAINLSTPSVQVLSAHGGLEKVALFVKSITTGTITTLISNYPSLILLYIETREPLCDDNGASVDQEDYKGTISKRFFNHKLLTTGDFILRKSRSCFFDCEMLDFDTNSFW